MLLNFFQNKDANEEIIRQNICNVKLQPNINDV